MAKQAQWTNPRFSQHGNFTSKATAKVFMYRRNLRP